MVFICCIGIAYILPVSMIFFYEGLTLDKRIFLVQIFKKLPTAFHT